MRGAALLAASGASQAAERERRFVDRISRLLVPSHTDGSIELRAGVVTQASHLFRGHEVTGFCTS
jgi:hypothetical protein